MERKKLTIIHSPMSYEFVLDKNTVRITRKTILKHLFRYHEVEFIPRCSAGLAVTFRTLLLTKILSRGKSVIVYPDGHTKNITVFSLIKPCVSFLKSTAEKSLVLREIKAACERFAHEIEDRGKAHGSLTRTPVDLSKPAVYLRTNLQFNVTAGGTVGHIAGVLNNLGFYGPSPFFLTVGHIPTVDSAIQTIIMEPSPEFVDFREIWDMHCNTVFFNKACEALSGTELSFIFQRYCLYNYTGVELSRHFRVPLVLEYNGSEVWVTDNWARPLKYRPLAVKIEHVNIRYADVITTISRPLFDDLVRRGVDPGKIVLNPNGVDPGRYSPDVDGTEVRRKYELENYIVIGFIGTFGPWHGAEVLAEAFGILMARYPHYRTTVRLLMIGDGTTMPLVRNNLGKNNVENCCILAGMQPQEEGPKYLAAADVLVSPHMPNSDGTPFFGSPTKLFEYMAMGKGIVASDLDQIGEILEHDKTAWLVPPGDTDALAEGLHVLIDNEQLRKRLGENARKEVVEKYTWREHTRKIIEKLKEVTGA
ncbi:glycosyltransferase family 4 protein [bacterium]|nr:glycosyltransferase family 4 protein [bacterium]